MLRSPLSDHCAISTFSFGDLSSTEASVNAPYSILRPQVPPTSLNSSFSGRNKRPCKRTVDQRRFLQNAFGPRSIFPNEALARLLSLTSLSPFVLNHRLEPTVDSEEGQALIQNIRYLPDCPTTALQWSTLSIFTLFVNFQHRRCLLCGSKKTSLERAVGCVRSHLDHRPFICGIHSVRCASCNINAT